MTVLDQVLELLRDGKWHRERDIKEKMGLTNFKSKLIIHFLASYGFCHYSRGEIRMKPELIDFFNELEKGKL